MLSPNRQHNGDRDQQQADQHRHRGQAATPAIATWALFRRQQIQARTTADQIQHIGQQAALSQWRQRRVCRSAGQHGQFHSQPALLRLALQHGHVVINLIGAKRRQPIQFKPDDLPQIFLGSQRQGQDAGQCVRSGNS